MKKKLFKLDGQNVPVTESLGHRTLVLLARLHSILNYLFLRKLDKSKSYIGLVTLVYFKNKAKPTGWFKRHRNQIWFDLSNFLIM